MSLIIQPKRWSIKPPCGAQILWGHPIARGMAACFLLNEGGGQPKNLLNGAATSPTSAPSWTPTPYGIGRQYDDGTPAYDIIAQASFGTPLVVAGGSPFSWHLIFSPSQVTATQWRAQFNSVINGSTPKIAVLTGRTSGKITYYADGNGYTDGSVVSAGQWIHVVGTWSGATSAGAVKFYLNGSLDATLTGSAAAAAAGILFLGAGFANTAGTTTVAASSVWSRELAPVEVQQLYVDPYCFMQPQSPQRRYWGITAAGASFLPAWASGCNQVIGGGYVS